LMRSGEDEDLCNNDALKFIQYHTLVAVLVDIVSAKVDFRLLIDTT